VLGSRFRATLGYTSPVGILPCLETERDLGGPPSVSVPDRGFIHFFGGLVWVRLLGVWVFVYFFALVHPALPIFPENCLFTLLPWLNKSFVFIWSLSFPCTTTPYLTLVGPSGELSGSQANILCEFLFALLMPRCHHYTIKAVTKNHPNTLKYGTISGF